MVAYADSIRFSAPTIEQIASLIEGIFGSTFATPSTAWTPTYSGGDGTWSGTTALAKYVQIGKLVLFYVQSNAVGFTGTSTYVTFTIPVAAAAAATPVPAAGWVIPDSDNLKGAAIYRGSSTRHRRVA